MYGARKQIKVFISSAMWELEPEREIAQETLKKMSLDPVLFELFPAMNDSPSAAYVDAVEDCDIFIIILWKSLSDPVAEEYYAAIKKSKPILVLVKNLVSDEKRENQLLEFLNNLRECEKAGVVRPTVYKVFSKRPSERLLGAGLF